MPKFKHTVSTEYKESFRSAKVSGMFDVTPEKMLTKHWDVDIPVEDLEWKIGVIIGPSGSGKTTIAKAAFPEAKFFDGLRHENWDSNCLLDDFAEDIDASELTDALSKVGFSSPPNWLLPFKVLSNGQKFRAEMARMMVELKDGEIAMVDEFTSVVDRNVGKICSAAISKMIKKSKQNKRLIAVTCHYDILEWLEPDWVYFVETGEFKLTRGSLRRPRIELRIQRVHHSAWRLFKGHHYLSADIHRSAHCYVAFIDDTPVAFAAALAFPHNKVKNMWKGHRTVVLPDYQGIGIGSALSDALGEYYVSIGKRYTSLTSHPAMIAHRLRSPKWVMTRKPGRVAPVGKTGRVSAAPDRVSASFEYVGEPK